MFQLAMGHGFSGEVAKVGASVHLWLPGREVMGIVPLDYNRPACASLVVVNQYDVGRWLHVLYCMVPAL